METKAAAEEQQRKVDPESSGIQGKWKRCSATLGIQGERTGSQGSNPRGNTNGRHCLGSPSWSQVILARIAPVKQARSVGHRQGAGSKG